MQLFVWRSSNRFSSWSMMDEPKIYKENYLEAAVGVVAESKEQALRLLADSEKWDRDELERFEPEVVSLNKPGIVLSHLVF